MSSLIGQLRVMLSLDSAAFETGAKRADARLQATGSKAEILGDKVGKMGKALVVAGAAMAGSAIVSQLASLVRQGLDHASALGEQAQQLGVSTKALQEYRYAATQVGLSQDEMDAGLSKLTKSLSDAATGAKGPAAAFDKLGIDVKAFVAAGGDAGDLIPKIAEGMKGLGSEVERNAVGYDLWGKSFLKMKPLLADGAGGIEKMRAEAQKYGMVLDEAMIRNADAAADKLSFLSTILNAKLSVAVAARAGDIEKMADAFMRLIDQAGLAVGKIESFLRKIDEFKARKAAFEAGVNADLYGMSPLPADQKKAAGFRAERDRALAIIRSENGGLRANSKTIDASKMNDLADPTWPKGGYSTGAPAKPGSGPMAPEFLKMGTGVGHPLMAAMPIPLMFSMIEGLPEQIKLSSDELENLSAMVASLTERLLPGEAALKQYKEEMGALDAAGAAGILSPERLAQLKTQLVDTSEGMASMLDRIVFGTNEIQNATDVVQANLEEIGSRAVVAGERMKGSFLDAADSIISAVDRIGYAFSSGGGGGFLGKLSAVMNLGMTLGGLGAFGKGFQTNVKALSGARAAGGPVNAGGVYLIGERGPELFAPGQSGTVIPNHAMGGGVQRIEVRPSPYFEVAIDGRVQQAAPMIAAAGAEGGVRKMAYRQSRRVG